jgi:hypothetical protein
MAAAGEVISSRRNRMPCGSSGGQSNMDDGNPLPPATPCHCQMARWTWSVSTWSVSTRRGHP